MYFDSQPLSMYKYDDHGDDDDDSRDVFDVHFLRLIIYDVLIPSS